MTTDNRGIYRLSNLEPNRYVVSVLSVQSTVLASTPEGAQRGALGELLTGGIGSGEKPIVRTPGLDVDERHRLVLTNFATPPAPQSDSPQRVRADLSILGVTSLADALSVEIAYGTVRTGVDFQLRPVAAVRVSGRLDGVVAPVPAMLLRMLPAGSERLGVGSEAATTTVAPDGSFTFLNVPVGQVHQSSRRRQSWTLRPAPRTCASAMRRVSPAAAFLFGGLEGVPGLSYLSRQGQNLPAWGRTLIAVGTRPIDNLVVRMLPAIAIRGRVVFHNGGAPPRTPNS